MNYSHLVLMLWLGVGVCEGGKRYKPATSPSPSSVSSRNQIFLGSPHDEYPVYSAGACTESEGLENYDNYWDYLDSLEELELSCRKWSHNGLSYHGVIHMTRAIIGVSDNMHDCLPHDPVNQMCREGALASFPEIMEECQANSECTLVARSHFLSSCYKDSTYMHILYQCIPERNLFSLCEQLDEDISGTNFFYSSDYPFNYPNQISCRCRFTFDHNGRSLDSGGFLLRDLDFSIEDGYKPGECPYDGLRVVYFDHVMAEVKNISLCGDLPRGHQVRAVTDTLFLQFYSDKSVMQRGVWLSMKATDPKKPNSKIDIHAVCGGGADWEYDYADYADYYDYFEYSGGGPNDRTRASTAGTTTMTTPSTTTSPPTTTSATTPTTQTSTTVTPSSSTTQRRTTTTVSTTTLLPTTTTTTTLAPTTTTTTPPTTTTTPSTSSTTTQSTTSTTPTTMIPTTTSVTSPTSTAKTTTSTTTPTPPTTTTQTTTRSTSSTIVTQSTLTPSTDKATSRQQDSTTTSTTATTTSTTTTPEPSSLSTAPKPLPKITAEKKSTIPHSSTSPSSIELSTSESPAKGTSALQGDLDTQTIIIIGVVVGVGVIIVAVAVAIAMFIYRRIKNPKPKGRMPPSAEETLRPSPQPPRNPHIYFRENSIDSGHPHSSVYSSHLSSSGPALRAVPSNGSDHYYSLPNDRDMYNPAPSPRPGGAYGNPGYADMVLSKPQAMVPPTAQGRRLAVPPSDGKENNTSASEYSNASTLDGRRFHKKPNGKKRTKNKEEHSPDSSVNSAYSYFSMGSTSSGNSLHFAKNAKNNQISGKNPTAPFLSLPRTPHDGAGSYLDMGQGRHPYSTAEPVSGYATLDALKKGQSQDAYTKLMKVSHDQWPKNWHSNA